MIIVIEVSNPYRASDAAYERWETVTVRAAAERWEEETGCHSADAYEAIEELIDGEHDELVEVDDETGRTVTARVKEEGSQ